MRAIYVDARVRCVVARPGSPEFLDLAFDIDGVTTRLRLPRNQVVWLVEAIEHDYLGTNSQSPTSWGSPSSEGSPQDGQSVCPPARSSSACCGES